MRDYKELFNLALANPPAVAAEDYRELLSRYPYARALHIAAYAAGQKHTDKEDYAELTDIGLFTHPIWTGVAPEEVTEAILETAETTSSGDGQQDVVDDVSVYHDEHLPYSFIWWLNKTRLDYAHTYKPYAPQQTASRRDRDPDGLIDQQIRENIFHLLEPDEKLSIPASGGKDKDIPFQVPKRTDPIIDRFIQEDPKISPPRPEKLSFENKARKSASDRPTIVTETLARIYEEQGLYTKAIEVYEKLSLKYPEKSGYFADRIDVLKNKLI